MATESAASSSGSHVQHQYHPTISQGSTDATPTLPPFDQQEAKVSKAAKVALSGGVGALAGAATLGITVLVIGLSLTGVGIAIAAAVIAIIAIGILLNRKPVEKPKEQTVTPTIAAPPKNIIDGDPKLLASKESYVKSKEEFHKSYFSYTDSRIPDSSEFAPHNSLALAQIAQTKMNAFKTQADTYKQALQDKISSQGEKVRQTPEFRDTGYWSKSDEADYDLLEKEMREVDNCMENYNGAFRDVSE